MAEKSKNTFKVCVCLDADVQQTHWNHLVDFYVVYLGPNLQKVMVNCVLFCFFAALFLCCTCRKALLLLKKKRYQDQLLDKTENQVSNLELMVGSIIFVASYLKAV